MEKWEFRDSRSLDILVGLSLVQSTVMTLDGDSYEHGVYLALMNLIPGTNWKVPVTQAPRNLSQRAPSLPIICKSSCPATLPSLVHCCPPPRSPAQSEPPHSHKDPILNDPKQQTVLARKTRIPKSYIECTVVLTLCEPFLRSCFIPSSGPKQGRSSGKAFWASSHKGTQLTPVFLLKLSSCDSMGPPFRVAMGECPDLHHSLSIHLLSAGLSTSSKGTPSH